MAKRRDRQRQDVDQPNVARNEIPDPSFIPPTDSDEALFGKPRPSASTLEKQVSELQMQLEEAQTAEGEMRVGDFVLTKMGMEFRGKALRLEDWRGMGSYLQQHQDAIQWMIGDWVNLAEPFLREWAGPEFDTETPEGKYQWIASQTNYSYSRLRNLAWVARQIPMSRRRDMLTFSHHMEVAHLSPLEQENFLDQAEPKEDRKRLSVRALRELINGPSITDGEDQAENTSPIKNSIQRIQSKLSKWEKWTPAQRRATYNELKALLHQLEELGIEQDS